MINDLRFSLRTLGRQPGFAAAAILTLAVGIGATIAIFSTVNATLLRPLPFPQPANLYAVYTPATDGRFTTGRCSGVELARLNVPDVSIVRAAGSTRIDTTILRDDGTPMASVGYGVTDGFFDVFQTAMAAGRPLTASDHVVGAASVVVISHRLWRDVYGGEAAAIGRPLRLVNGPPTPPTIVGVAPSDFEAPGGGDFWTAFSITPQSTGHGFDGYLRIKPGTPLQRLESEMAAAMAGIASDYGNLGKNRRYELKPLVDAIVGDLRPTLLIVLSAAALLLALACVNVTNLLLARGATRSRELALRVVLGAGRGRIVRQLMVEALVLATAGTILGLFLAYAGLRLLLALGASGLPRLDRVSFDGRLAAFALGALAVTTLLVGLAPALRFAGTSLRTLVNEGGRGSTIGGGTHRLLKTMIIAEIALAITLVAGAGWLVRSFANLERTDAGVVSEGRLVFDVQIPPARIFPLPGGPPITPGQLADRLLAWRRDVDGRLRAIGGVTEVATTSTLPFGIDRDAVLYVGVQGEPIDREHPNVARVHRVSQEFFGAMGIRLVAGRGFTADDRASSAPVAVVNRTFARRYLGGRDPIGVQFAAGYPEVPATPLISVVGVVEDVKYVSLAQAADPAYYTPEAQAPYFAPVFVLKTAMADPMAAASSVRSAMQAVEPQIPIAPQALG